jgi:hypothetical protein
VKVPVAGFLVASAFACSRGVEPYVDEFGLLPGPPVAGESAWIVSGVVEVSPDSGDAAAEGGVLFVTARLPGERMPAAVERYEGPVFPLPFVLRAGHGGEPGGGGAALVVGARLSREGAAGPARPGDLEGTASKLAVPGDTGVRVVLAVVR